MSRKEINDNIENLQYDSKKVLAFNGTTITDFVPKSGVMKNDAFIVTTRTKNTMSGDYDIAIPNAYASITYPGALLVANSKLVEGTPTALAAKRAPIALTIDLPGLIEEGSVEVENPEYRNVNAAISKALETWYADKSKDHAIKCNIQYNSSILYDENSMALKFGCDASYMGNKLGIDFNLIRDQKKSAYLVQFKQIYYTVSVEPPKHPADVFAEDVEWDDISRKINNDNPPVYVQNVQYGREIYFLLESAASSKELEAFVNGTLKYDGTEVNANVKADYKKFASSVQTKVVVIGGKPISIKTSGSIEEITADLSKVISEGVVLGKENPAMNLCYTTAFLKDNITAKILGRSEYVTTESEVFTSGNLKLIHTGAYVARFNVDWKEVSFDKDGNEILTKKEWGQNGKNKTAKYEEVICLPANARDIHVTAEGKTGLVWQPWTKSLDTPPMPLVKNRSIHISGTTLNQKAQVNPEA